MIKFEALISDSKKDEQREFVSCIKNNKNFIPTLCRESHYLSLYQQILISW